MSNNQEEDPLEALLALAESEFDKPQENDQNDSDKLKDLLKTDEKPKQLTEFDIFGSLENNEPSTIHNGDTDSSEDEDNRNFEDQKYNESGKQIKQLLTSIDDNQISTSHYGQPKKRVSTWKEKPRQSEVPLSSHKPLLPILKSHPFGSPHPNLLQEKPKDVLIDPFFGIKIVNPMISHSTIVERMQGREAVQLSTIQRFLMRNSFKDKDWVICGVVVGKSPLKTSQKGSQYSIWSLSDLKDDIKTVALFLFSGAHKDLWKTAVGTVIGVLNPGVLDRRDNSKDEAALSVDNAQKVMTFGTSKDYGLCKSLKKTGEKCNAVVNLSVCEYCMYHIKQEYQKCSKRSELQANFVGKGLTALRNKVLGKNEVFYAGKSYMSIPAKKSVKMQSKDKDIMNKLNGINVNSNPIVKAKNTTKRSAARHLDVSPAQRLKDIELLKKLGGGIENKTNFSNTHSSSVTLESSKLTAQSVINKLKSKPSGVTEVPRSSQYNLKNDLIVNVEGKRNFSGKISEDVTMTESKYTALSVISKLKANNAHRTVSNQNENENKQIEDEQQSIEEMLSQFECDKDDFTYDDDFEERKESPVSQKPRESESMKENLCSSNVKESADVKTPKSASKQNFDLRIKESKIISSSTSSKEISTTKSPASTPKSNLEKTPKRNNFNLFDTPQSSNSSSKDNLSNSMPNNIDIRPQSRSLLSNTPKSQKSNNIGTKPQCLSQTALKSGNGMVIPTLSSFSNTDLIDLNVPVPKKYKDRAKLNAISFIQRHGPIKKADPNSTKGSGKKRPMVDILETQSTTTTKKSKLQESEFISDRWKKMMATTSKHSDLIEQHYDEEKEKYFKKLEVKEKMEDRMASTYKVACKAVKCLKCKYTSFSASDLCKAEGHPLRVCKKFDQFGSKLLSRGFYQLEKRHNAIYKRVKAALPRRESERKTHPLARHCDILQGVETRISMLNMTYSRYIDNKLVCFIPGKVLDEMRNVLNLVGSNKQLPRTHQILQELRDLSSMAMEHFEEFILPGVKEKLEHKIDSPERILKELEVVTGPLYASNIQDILSKSSPSSSRSSRLLLHQQVQQTLSSEIMKIKKATKIHKGHISQLTQTSKRITSKLRNDNFIFSSQLRRQANRLREQHLKLRKQEIKIQQQSSKIHEQDATITEIKRHIEEWEQKYNDLTAELVRARDEIIRKATTSQPTPVLHSPPILPVVMPSCYKSNIKPRMSQVLPKTHLPFDFERKRKPISRLSPEVPVKRQRSPMKPKEGDSLADDENYKIKIPDLANFEKSTALAGTSACPTSEESLVVINTDNGCSTSTMGLRSVLSKSLDNLLMGPSGSTIKARKRKMTEDIDLK